MNLFRFHCFIYTLHPNSLLLMISSAIPFGSLSCHFPLFSQSCFNTIAVFIEYLFDVYYA